jgi:hypothetical protein
MPELLAAVVAAAGAARAVGSCGGCGGRLARSPSRTTLAQAGALGFGSRSGELLLGLALPSQPANCSCGGGGGEVGGGMHQHCPSLLVPALYPWRGGGREAGGGEG